MSAPADTGKSMPEGFFKIYDAHHDGVHRLIHTTVRDAWAADDLVQETFLRVLTKLDSLREPSKLRTWIYSIALNLCRDHWRTRSSRPQQDGVQPEEAPILERMAY